MDNPAKMQAIADQLNAALKELNVPYLRLQCDDDIMSSIIISGSFDKPETWINKIFENSRYFRLRIMPKDGKRYYDAADDKVTLELMSGWRVEKLRKSTSPPAKIIERIVAWLKLQMV